MRKHAQTKPEGERGFALLVVFLVAAGIMISLYLEIPRVAFESQREREEILIERGEQYSRAIEVFFRKNKRYPQKIEDLESYNNLRFLRRRYKDPLTGKDEWRMVHMGPNGQLADSLVEKPGQVPGQTAANGTNGQPGATGATGTTPTQTAQGVAGVNGVPGATGDTDVNVAQSRLRASDRNPNRPGMQQGGGAYMNPGAATDPNNPNAQPGVFDPNNPQQVAQQVPPQGYNPNNPQQGGFNPNVPTQTTNGNQFPTFPGQAPQYPGANGINPSGVQPGFPQQVGPGAQGFSPGAALQGQIAAQNGQDPSQAGFGQNPALSSINNNLRNQPSAANGLGPSAVGTTNTNTSGFSNSTSGFSNSTSGFGTPVQTSAPSGGQSFGGGGIAGVASTQAGIGIKKYNDKSKYKEWEFIFDYRKPKGNAAAGTNIGTGPNGQPANAAATGASTSGFNSQQPSGFGASTPPPQPPPQPPPPNQ